MSHGSTRDAQQPNHPGRGGRSKQDMVMNFALVGGSQNRCVKEIAPLLIMGKKTTIFLLIYRPAVGSSQKRPV
jgi:hypothetical protein